MDSATQASLWSYVAIAALVGFAIYRRTRRQRVRPGRDVAIAAVIVVLSALGLVASGRSHPLSLLLAPLALGVGFGLGWVMMRTIRFWRDASGQLWMQGGVLYIVIWLATFVLRLALRAATGPQAGSSLRPAGAPQSQPEALAIASADLLFVSMGLWIARAVALVRRSRVAGI